MAATQNWRSMLRHYKEDGAVVRSEIKQVTRWPSCVAYGVMRWTYTGIAAFLRKHVLRDNGRTTLHCAERIESNSLPPRESS